MNIKKINRAKRIEKARNMRRNNQPKGFGPIPMSNGWISYKAYLEGFRR